jgi:uncharacterized protein YjbI with pentapeptide repeats
VDERITEPRMPATDYDPDTAPPRIRVWQRLLAWLTTRRLVAWMIGLAAVIFAMGGLPDLLDLPEWIPPVQKLVDDLYGNFFTEALSIAVTIGVIDLLNQRRLEDRRRQELVDQLSSRVPGFPAEAVRLLKHRGWYQDRDVMHALQNGGDFELADLRGLRIPDDISGLRVEHERLDLSEARLEKADLRKAYLEGVHLFRAHLGGADLRGAHLDGTNSWEVHLERADLRWTKLEDAYLVRAQLTEADLTGTHLERANLNAAHLEGANLLEAHLKEASLYFARLTGASFLTVDQLEAASTLQGCLLPDGTRLPYREERDDPEPDWRAALAAWVARGREEGWIYDHHVWDEGYIDVGKIPPREDEQGGAV